jgi:hypothetical protein
MAAEGVLGYRLCRLLYKRWLWQCLGKWLRSCRDLGPRQCLRWSITRFRFNASRKLGTTIENALTLLLFLGRLRDWLRHRQRCLPVLLEAKGEVLLLILLRDVVVEHRVIDLLLGDLHLQCLIVSATLDAPEELVLA